MEFMAEVKLVDNNLFDDFAATLNKSINCLTEFSFAQKGSSKFNKAIYVDKVSPSFLDQISSRDCNVAFLADCMKEKITAPLNKMVFRQTKNETILKKSILSFDIDFKTINAEFLSTHLSSKLSFAIAIAGKFIEKIQQNNLPVWIINFSGNGLHLHFKLAEPIIIKTSDDYGNCYRHWCNILNLALGDNIVFDESCKNVARLMRLPLSTNWKNLSLPIKNEVLFHQPNADASAFFSQQKVQPTLNIQINIQSFKKILEHFSYQKSATLTQRGKHIVCSSPFSKDVSPSFYFYPEKNVFYDFSTGKGGGLYTLISELAGLKSSNNKQEIEQILDEILGPTSKIKNIERYSIRNDGIWLNKEVDGDDTGLWICSPLTVKATL